MHSSSQSLQPKQTRVSSAQKFRRFMIHPLAIILAPASGQKKTARTFSVRAGRPVTQLTCCREWETQCHLQLQYLHLTIDSREWKYQNQNISDWLEQNKTPPRSNCSRGCVLSIMNYRGRGVGQKHWETAVKKALTSRVLVLSCRYPEWWGSG